MAKDEHNPFVGIAGAVGGITMIMVLFVGIFMEDQAWILAPIAVAMAAMGIALGYFASKKK